MPCRSRLHRASRARAVTVVAWIITAVVAWPAHAQRPRDAAAEASALELNRRSRELYRQGHYAEAAALLREAYRRKPEPVIQYNLARACEMMDDYACVVAAYESYLPNARPEERTAIDARLALYRARLAARTAAPAGPGPPAGSRPSHTILAPMVTVTGVVGFGVGLALASVAHSRHDDAVDDPTLTGGAQKQDSAVSLMRTANIALIAGGTVAVAGAIWWIINAASDRSASPEPPAGVARLHIGAGSVAVSVRF